MEPTLKLPDQIKLLFDNEYLDTFTVLTLLSAFPSKKAGISLRQVIYYYSIVLSEEGHDHSDTLSNIYFKFEKKMKSLIIRLHSLGVIEVAGSKEVTCKINETGKQLVDSFESSYFTELRKKAGKFIAEVPFSPTMEKQIFGGHYGSSNKNK